MSGFGSMLGPVSVQGLTDVNTNLTNIQRSLSELLQTISSVTVTTNFIVDATPFLNNGTVPSAGTITAATLAASSLIGNATGAGAIPTAIGVSAPLGFSGTNLTFGTIAASSLLANSSAIGAVPTATGLTSALAFTAGSLGFNTIAASSLLANSSGIGAVPAATGLTSALAFTGGNLGFNTIAATTVLANAAGVSSTPTPTTVSGSLSFIAGALNVPTSLPPNGAAGGDLGSTYPNPTVLQVHGVTTNSSAAAGFVGEYISSTVLVGSAVALTTATPANVTSISLTAGDWDVTGTVAFNPAGTTTQTILTGAVSQTSATLPTIPGSGAYASLGLTFTVGVGSVLPLSTTRVSLAGTTTVYLVAQATFAVSTMGAFGFLGARRVR